jgi:ElaB/YqjD/DUF883 family membrane-anchored ribosome-binding protein
MLAANKNEQAKCDGLCECAAGAGRKARALVDDATGQARDGVAVVSRKVRSHPLQATAIAAGIGLALGALIRRLR